MSFFGSALKRLGGTGSVTVVCPICERKSSQPASKVRQEQTLLCPECKSLFVIRR